LNDEIELVGRRIIRNQLNLNNQFLKNMADDGDIVELNWFNENGEIVYSSIDSYVGWEAPSDHPVQSFITSNKTLYVEKIRQDTESGEFRKYGYVKSPNGYFVQVGLNADQVQVMTNEFSYQSLVDEITNNEEIVYGLFINKNLEAVAHSNHDRIGRAMTDAGSKIAAVDGEFYSSEYPYESEDEIIEVYDVIYPLTIDGKHVGALNIGFSMNKVENLIRKNILIFSGLGIIIFFLIGSVLYVNSNNISKPIIELSNTIEKLSNFDLRFDENKKIEKYLNRKDEIGTITKALGKMQTNFIQIIKNVTEASEQVSSSSEELTAMSQQSASASDEVAKTIEEIASGATDQARETTEGAEEINELGSIIASEIELVEILNTSAKEVNQLKEEGFTVLKDLEEKTNENNNAAREVQEIIIETNRNADEIESASDMIKGIAEQTNLLALNASIEAARAGEAGKGFAVVADEIRKLAEETNQFASQISDTINTLNNMTEKGVKTMDNASKIVKTQMESLDNTHHKFEGISEAVEKVQRIVEELNVSTENMMNKKTQIINVIENLSAISQENAASTEEASASVEEQTASMMQISEASEELSKLAEEMQGSVSKFKI
jgi:methyl-accepting chemotaxis protein